eukprot:5254057-Pleurochrysis_carterae.AAC.4
MHSVAALVGMGAGMQVLAARLGGGDERRVEQLDTDAPRGVGGPGRGVFGQDLAQIRARRA